MLPLTALMSFIARDHHCHRFTNCHYQ